MSVAFVTHPDYLTHDTGPGHPERPDRLRAILDGMDRAGLREVLMTIDPVSVDPEILAHVHTRAYIQQVKDLATHGGGALDPDTVVSPRSHDVALLAAGGAAAATAAVLDGRAAAAFAAVRPPGHHALPDHGMGFCLFNNVACAAETALRRSGVGRVCIVDWDVHHGNGTQAIFYRENRVLFISLHQEHWYPGTGAAAETGAGDGVGFTVNIPLPAGVGDEGYRTCFEEIVCPVLTESAPDLILISAGYDAHYGDPLGGMLLTAAGFRALTDLVRQTRPDGTRVVAVLEGGYDPHHLSNSVLATLGGLLDRAVPIDERPGRLAEVPYATLRTRLRQVRGIVHNYWNI